MKIHSCLAIAAIQLIIHQPIVYTHTLLYQKQSFGAQEPGFNLPRWLQERTAHQIIGCRFSQTVGVQFPRWFQHFSKGPYGSTGDWHKDPDYPAWYDSGSLFLQFVCVCVRVGNITSNTFADDNDVHDRQSHLKFEKMRTHYSILWLYAEVLKRWSLRVYHFGENPFGPWNLGSRVGWHGNWP